MTDPYKVLGVLPTDSDRKIKDAYRALAKKYHPDNYNQSPLIDVAQEKMQEINVAFDEIMDQRKGKKTSGGYNYADKSQSYNYSGETQSTSSNPVFQQIRQYIILNQINIADKMLDEVKFDDRNAEWFFLKGSVYYKRGWLDEAFQNVSQAAGMEPTNAEYRAAFEQMLASRNGRMNSNPFNSYRTTHNGGGCNMCTSLICADCCCECMGGDLIGCC